MAANGEHQVIPFRPRGFPRAGQPGWQRHEAHSPLASRTEPDDLRRYEAAPDMPGEYRHRMLVNVIGGAFAVALTAIGIWLVITIADMRKTQDCMLSGRKDCSTATNPNLRR